MNSPAQVCADHQSARRLTTCPASRQAANSIQVRWWPDSPKRQRGDACLATASPRSRSGLAGVAPFAKSSRRAKKSKEKADCYTFRLMNPWLPRSIQCLRDYDRQKFLSDLLAGVTV